MTDYRPGDLVRPRVGRVTRGTDPHGDVLVDGRVYHSSELDLIERAPEMIETPTPQQVLSCPLPDGNDAGARTIGDYLIALLATLWEQGEDMVKRPFGNSGWQYDLYDALGHAGYIQASFDSDGCTEELDHDQGDGLIMKAIESLGTGSA